MSKKPERARWYPIDCEHGYDCCPICDGERRDTITLAPLRQTENSDIPPEQKKKENAT